MAVAAAAEVAVTMVVVAGAGAAADTSRPPLRAESRPPADGDDSQSLSGSS